MTQSTDDKSASSPKKKPATPPPAKQAPPAAAPPPVQPVDYVDRHIQVGWTAVAVFVLLGMTLEALHGFKVGAYLDVTNSTRRLMWTLAHSHGTLLGLMNLAFAALFDRMRLATSGLNTLSNLLVGATVLMPVGFFLGGLQFHGGDPGLGVLLVPIGGTMLVAALFGIVWSMHTTRRTPKR